MLSEHKEHVKGNRYMQYSQVFLWLGHILSLLILIKMMKAISWGLQNKEDFLTCFLSSFGSTDLLVEQKLVDGSFQFSRVGPDPLVGTLILIIIPIALYSCSYVLRKKWKENPGSGL